MSFLLQRVTWAGAALLLGLAARLQAGDRFDTAYLSEFLAANPSGLRDEDGDRPGWIELHNGGAKTVDLEGWFLTDTPTNLTKWRFPRVKLLADKFLIVFASGKDRGTPTAPLHANFTLDPAGNYLALVNPLTNVVSEFSARPQQPAWSDGRVRGEPALRGFFRKPTPGKPNASKGDGFAPEVTISPWSGNFLEPMQVSLTCAAPDAVIRYTLDGSLPTSASPTWSGPQWITNTTHLRARAFQEGRLPGPPASAAYQRLAPSAAEFVSRLPLLVLNTFGQSEDVGRKSDFVRLSLHEPVRGVTSLTNPPSFTLRGGFHQRGSTTGGLPQSGFALDFVDEFNEDKDYPLLGMPAESEWVLYAPSYLDPSMIHNPFVHQLSRDLGRYSPRTRFVEVFLSRSAGGLGRSNYFGLYVLEEKIKISPHRVAIHKLDAEDLQPPKVTGGYLLKFDRLGPGERGFAAGGNSMVFVEPKEPTMLLPQRAPQREYLRNYLDEFNRALHGPDWKDPEKGYATYLDVPAAIDFHVVEVLSGNVDAMVLSTYFYKPREGKITFEPHWDFDRALGSTDGRDANPRRWRTGPFFGGAWLPKAFTDPDFWQLWVDRWQELRREQFSLDHMFGLIDRLADQVREAQPRQRDRWGLQPRGGSYQAEIVHLKNWVSNRVDYIDGQLTQPPRLSPPGGSVAPGFQLTMTAAPGATIYYTLDGTDPRLPQGEISPAAVAYTSPLSLAGPAQVVARAHNPNQRQSGGPPSSTPWSGPVRAEFHHGQP